MRVLIAVTHLLGVGHLARAAAWPMLSPMPGMPCCWCPAVGRTPSIAGKGVRTAHLPSVHAEGADFVNLRDADGRPVTSAYLEDRAQHLVHYAADFTPDCIITETFPFGRNALRREFEALLEYADGAAPRPVMLASIRDILNPPSRPQRRTARKPSSSNITMGCSCTAMPNARPCPTPGRSAAGWSHSCLHRIRRKSARQFARS